MGLKNVFDYVATEGTLQELVRIFKEGRFMPYAKTPSDAMRVNVENGITVTSATVYQANSASAIAGGTINVAPHSTSSWNVVDAREPMRDMTLQSFQAARSRWSIT
jgi:hypothetical protein